MAETIWLRGEGGSVIEFDTPLSPPIASRLARGYLRRVNPDGSTYVEPADTPANPDVPPPATTRPAKSAPKAAWVAYAVHAHGVAPDVADGMTRTDLIDRYGTP